MLPAPKPTAPPRSLTEIKEERKLVRAQIQEQRLKYESQLLESLTLLLGDDFGGSDLWTRLRDADGTQWIPVANPTDRRKGANWPLFRSEQELRRYQQASRVLCASNSYAKGLLKNVVNYTVAQGFGYNAASKETIEPGADDPATVRIKQLVKEAQNVIDRFLRRNRWNGLIDPRGSKIVTATREREIARRLIRDGEVFLRFYRELGGDLCVRFIEPEQVRNPPAGTAEQGWSYGIRHQMEPFEDVETPEEYYVAWMDASEKTDLGEFVPASEMLHLRHPETDANCKRCIPEFAFDTLASLERASKLQRCLSVGAAVKAATAETWKHTSGATAAGISDMRAAMADLVTTDPLTGNSEKQIRVRPGTIRDVPAGQEPVPESPSNTPAYIQGVQADLRQGSAAFCAPEYWTGDASNSNYSSLETASAPPVKAGQCDQEYLKMAFALVVWQAVAWAVECQLLPEDVFDLVDIQVEAPTILHRNELEMAQVRQIEKQNQVLSRSTWCAETGRDPEIELANIEEDNDRLGANAQLPLPADQAVGAEAVIGGGMGDISP